MRFVDLIKKKRDGLTLTTKEIQTFIDLYVANEIPDYQVSSLLMAIYFNGMSDQEITDLTLAMMHSGDVLDLTDIDGVIVDKHSTGGVGDKTSLVLGPLLAAAGVKVAKMSGRGLGHTGGTIDKLEAIEGFHTELSQQDFIDQVNRLGIAIIGQTGNLTPADKKLYALRDVTATVESIPLIASSIMSKKLAAGADVIALDVKVGSGAFMKNLEQAEQLAQEMVKIGKNVGKKVIAFLTNMDEPLGYKIGNSLEIMEVIDTLKGQGPADLTELCLEIGSYLLQKSKENLSLQEAKTLLERLLANGKALEKFNDFIEAQGGKCHLIEGKILQPQIPQAKHTLRVEALQSGYIKNIDTEALGVAAMLLGAGRETKSDSIDYAVGLEVCAKIGTYVSKGETLGIIYSNGKSEQDAALKMCSAFTFVDEPVVTPKLIYKIIQ